MPKDTNDDQLGQSPLISKPASQSTINPDKMEKSRFTEIKAPVEEKSNPMRIVIYAVIVIIVGVGLAFLVRTLINNNNDGGSDNNTTQPPVSSPVEENDENAYEISLVAKSDSTATNLTSNDQYSNSEVTTLGNSTLNMTSVELNTISYDKYQSFARTTFEFTGNNGTLPKSIVAYSSTDNEIRVEFPGLTEINQALLTTEDINDLVTSISYDTSTSEFVLELKEASKYRAFNLGGNLAIDIKTVKALNSSTDESTTPPSNGGNTGTTTPPSSGTKPAAPHYTNEFSENQQYISSAVTTNTIGFNNFWIWDQGSFFEFSLGEINAVGDQYIPNATAYYDEENGQEYLMLEISNLSNAPFSQTKSRTLENLIETSGASINPANVNFVKVDLVSFTNGTATYKIEVKQKADFKLVSQANYDGTSQLLSVQIED